MDWLTFWAAVVKSAAWPFSVLLISISFRRDIRSLLAKLKKGKFGSAEFEFERDVQALADSSPQAPVSEPSPATSVAAAQNPRALILASWVNVEAAIRALAHRHINRLAVPIGRSASELLRQLESRGIVSAETGALFRDLRALRNQAAHEIDFNPSPESALEFLNLANELRDRLARTQ